MTLKTSVISANRKEHVTVDAGLKLIYLNPKKPITISHNGLIYDWSDFGDEHGKVSSINNYPLPKVGEVKMIVPHCDPTINLYNNFHITNESEAVEKWLINMRGLSQ